MSPVFHGRDIFAPVAGHLVAGGELEDVGAMIEPSSLVRLPEPEVRREDGATVGQVVHVDRFGNLITNLQVDADGVEGARVETAGRTVALRRTYTDVPEGEIVALVGSSGRLEIACNADSAARVLGASSGSVVVFRPRVRS